MGDYVSARTYSSSMADPGSSRSRFGTLAGWGALVAGLATLVGVLIPLFTSTNNSSKPPAIEQVKQIEDGAQEKNKQPEDTSNRNTEEEAPTVEQDTIENDIDEGSDENSINSSESPPVIEPVPVLPSTGPSGVRPEAREPTPLIERSETPVQPVPRLTAPPPSSSPASPPPQVPLDVRSQQVQFPSQSNGILVANSVTSGQIRRYIVNAELGQTLTAEITDEYGGNVTFDAVTPLNEIIPGASNVTVTSITLPRGGDYSINVKADQPSEFTLMIKLD